MPRPMVDSPRPGYMVIINKRVLPAINAPIAVNIKAELTIQKTLHKVPAAEASNRNDKAKVDNGKKTVQPSIITLFITEAGFDWVSCSSPPELPDSIRPRVAVSCIK